MINTQVIYRLQVPDNVQNMTSLSFLAGRTVAESSIVILRVYIKWASSPEKKQQLVFGISDQVRFLSVCSATETK